MSKKEKKVTEKINEGLKKTRRGTEFVTGNLSKIAKAIPIAGKPVAKVLDAGQGVINLGTGALQGVNYIADKVRRVFNHPEWYGGDSNTFTGPLGPFAQPRVPGKYSIMNNVYIVVDPGALIDLSQVAAQIESVIGAYDKQLGFPSDVTVQDIALVIDASVRALAVFKTAKRLQDSEQVPVFRGITFGDRLNYINGYLNYGDNRETNDTAGRLDLGRISNAVWAQLLGRLNTGLVLPRHVEFIEYLFDNHFTNGVDSGINSIIEFFPLEFETMCTGTELELLDVLEASIENLENSLERNPYIPNILLELGYSLIGEYDINLTRDLTRTTAITVDDPDIRSAIANMGNVDYVQNGLILSDHHDIDMNYSTLFEEFTVGKLGQLLKFNLMAGEIAGYSSLMYQIRPNLTKSNPFWGVQNLLNVGAQTNIFVLPNPMTFNIIDVVPVLFTHEAIQETLDEFNGITENAIVIDDFIGIDMYSSRKLAFGWSVEHGETYFFIEQPVAGRIYLLGPDTVQVSDMESVIAFIRTNFTIGEDYLKKVSQYISSISRKLSVS